MLLQIHNAFTMKKNTHIQNRKYESTYKNSNSKNFQDW